MSREMCMNSSQISQNNFGKSPTCFPQSQEGGGGSRLSEILLLFHWVLLSAAENLASYLESFCAGMLLGVWFLLKFLPQVKFFLFFIYLIISWKGKERKPMAAQRKLKGSGFHSSSSGGIKGLPGTGLQCKQEKKMKKKNKERQLYPQNK